MSGLVDLLVFPGSIFSWFLASSGLSRCCLLGLGNLPDASALAQVPLSEQGQIEETTQASDGSSLPWLGGPTPGCMALSKNFSLGETFPPIPEKLVTKIQSEEYVDLAELLPANVEVLRRAGAQPSAQGQGQRQLRRVCNLSTWVQCFATYAAILAEAHPHRTRDLFAYLRLIVREAQRHEGDGWRAYDVLFRKLAATNRTLKWDQPLPSLYATSFTTSRSSAPSVCEYCLEGDHKSAECALSPASAAVPWWNPERLVQFGLQTTFSFPGSASSQDPRPTGPGFADRPICKR